MWDYRDDVNMTDAGMVGYDVEATDGSIGKVDEASNDAGSQYLVVDTGFWIFGKKRLIPAGAIVAIDHESEKVAVEMTKDQIKDAPDFDEALSLDDSNRDPYDEYYRPFGW